AVYQRPPDRCGHDRVTRARAVGRAGSGTGAGVRGSDRGRDHAGRARPRGERGVPAGRVADYDGPVTGQTIPGGVVHELPPDLRQALVANEIALDAWNDITPLARNEFICWVEDAKQATTRERRIRRTQEELEEGQRRPCCWPGCKHRERNGH